MKSSQEDYQSSPRGDAWKLQGIFFEPKATFEEINKKPSFLLPFLLCLLISLLTAAAIYSVVDLRDLLESQLRASPSAAQMSSEEVEEQIDKLVNSPFWPVLKWAGPVVGPCFTVFVLSPVILLVVHLTGSETTFKKLLSVTSHSFFLYYLVASGLTVLIFYLSSNPRELDLESVVYSNLGPLVDSETSPILHRVAVGVDLINFYVIYLLGLGVSVVSRKISLAKGLSIVASLYLLYVLVAVAWLALVG